MASADDIKLRMADAIRDVQHLLSSGADKNQLLVGTTNRRGLNHVNELFMMLPDPPTAGGHPAEFKITP